LRSESGAQAGRGDGAVERLRLRRHQRDVGVPKVSSVGASSPLSPEQLTALEAALGHRFVDLDLLERALTHASYVNEHPPCIPQDGLAFVGDAALGLVVAERLLTRAPGAAAGPA